MPHTPGPWEYDSDSREVFSDTEKHGVGWIASVVGNDSRGIPLPDAERIGNALLISAAPEMLAALRLAHDALDFAQAQVDSENDAYQLRKWRLHIGHVITKAEGGK